MTLPRASVSHLRDVAAWEYVVRFVFGGAVTVATALAGKHFGPAIGGMLLAFPAILPASLTLVALHDGRREAIATARGARLATPALSAFAIVVAITAPSWPPVAFLPLATAAWLIAALVAWRLTT